MTTTVKDENRFETDAGRYAAYLATPEGRLRADLTFANLQDFVPSPHKASTLRALDLGGGTGAAALRLAQLGMKVTLLDSSEAMLDLAKRAVAEAGISDQVTLKQGDAAQLKKVFPSESFDVILCHNLLEYLDDPGEVLSDAVSLMRDPSSILSVLVRNQA